MFRGKRRRWGMGAEEEENKERCGGNQPKIYKRNEIDYFSVYCIGTLWNIQYQFVGKPELLRI